MFIKTIYINKKCFFLNIGFFLLVFGLFILPPIIEVLLTVLFIVFIAISSYSALLESDKKYLSIITIFPVFLSVIQNIYLGLAAYKMTRLELQILLALNITIAFILFVILQKKNIIKSGLWVRKCLVILLTYTCFMYLLYPTNVSSLVSSVRNIISPIIFFGITFFAGTKVDKLKIENYLGWISIFVIFFGFVEYYLGDDFWKSLNIGQLWILKGIGVNSWGVPSNWISSERINGNYLRRMVSSFADPVNLGTFLFAAYLCVWYRKKRILQFAIIACCVFTVSKGALLGFLIFFVIYFWYMDRTKISIPLILSGTVSIAGAFLYFSKISSSGSVAVHLNGFFNALVLPLKYPLGLGVGNVGVLASIFGSNTVYDTGVTETGIGKIIAELGIVGIVIYILFFYKLYRLPYRWKNVKKRKYIYFYSLLFSIIINIAFNEVALSPNSCGIYFLLLGCIVTEEKSIRI